MRIRNKTAYCAARRSACECARQPHSEGRHVCGGASVFDGDPCRGMWDDAGKFYRLPPVPRGYSPFTDLVMDLWVAAR